jgi:methylase of polypeptide subunit release factors
MSREAARAEIARLVERYLDSRDQYNSTNEAQTRLELINPFLEALGWDLTNRAGVSPSVREVLVEETVELADENDPASVGAAGNPDYTIQPAGRRRFFVEAKKPSVQIAVARAPAYQTRRYGWSAELSVSVLTNFAQLAIYDCRWQPDPDDEVAVARYPEHFYSCEDYVERFDDIWRALSKESVLSGAFDDEFAIERELRGEDTFNAVFLTQIRDWRIALAGDIAKRNETLDERMIALTTQRLLNCLVFLRVCEDRNLEEYKGLLKIEDRGALDARFREADATYNAGLFRALDDVDVDADLLHSLIVQLYYPRSPYAFSVVEAPILAAIYEQFLAERIELGPGRSVTLARKPEVAHASGIVPTPGYIADAILERTLRPLLANAPLDAVRDLRLIDLSCGSGVFLLQAFRLLLAHFEAAGVQPTLALKHEILRSNIFGVDINTEAVEVTRFNLMLAMLDGEDRESVARFDGAALPDIDARIVSGNSLITPHFLEIYPEARLDRDELPAVNPFDFNLEFPEVMQAGGFDVIVGNPPYVRIQTLAEFTPLQVTYFQEHSPFESARAFNFDKYLLFVERAIELLAPDGRLGYIVPHRFMSAFSGQAVRELLSGKEHVAELVHFGHEQVFAGTTTYTCLLIATSAPSPYFTFTQVDDLAAWREHGAVATPTSRTMSSSALDAAPWSFGADETRAVFDRLRQRHPARLREVADIFVGVQTSADDIYLFKPEIISADTVSFQHGSESWEVERSICRPALRDRTLRPYDGKPEPDAWAIFPYEIVDVEERPRAITIPPDRMEAEFPLAWAYLSANRERLERRDITASATATWYSYGRSQSLTKLDEDKIIIRVLSLRPQYNWDPDGLLVPGGGDGGPYYLMRPRSDSQVELPFLIALLSHPAIDAMVLETGGRAYRGGYFPHRKAFLEDIPVPLDDPALAGEIARLTQQLINTTMQLRGERDPEVRLVLERDRATQTAKIETQVSEILGLSSEDIKAVIGE